MAEKNQDQQSDEQKQHPVVKLQLDEDENEEKVFRNWETMVIREEVKEEEYVTTIQEYLVSVTLKDILFKNPQYPNALDIHRSQVTIVLKRHNGAHETYVGRHLSLLTIDTCQKLYKKCESLYIHDTRAILSFPGLHCHFLNRV